VVVADDAVAADGYVVTVYEPASHGTNFTVPAPEPSVVTGREWVVNPDGVVTTTEYPVAAP
jgi:hypothetical protein